MKTFLFIIIVTVSAIYLMAQTPKGLAMVENYFPWSDAQQTVMDSKEHLLDKWKETSDGKMEEQLSKLVAEMADSSLEQSQRWQEVQQRINFLEKQVAVLTQQQNGYRLAQTKNTVNHTPDSRQEFHSVKDSQSVNDGKIRQADGTRQKQDLLQQIADRQYQAALDGASG